MNIIERNFFRILRSGAFADKESIEPMSAFKWRQLFHVVEAQRVVPSFASGIKNQHSGARLNMPADITQSLEEKIATHEALKETISNNDVRMGNIFLNKRLKHIIDTELQDEEGSVETIDLLELLVYNVNTILNRGLRLDGIIQLGEYLRKWGDKVDFVKLDTWLAALHLKRMAQLQGSMLVSVFGFEQDELPFVDKLEKRAMEMVMKAITYQRQDTAEEWHNKRQRSTFVQNSSTVFRRNILRSIRYYRYAPIETASSLIGNIGKSLSEIEE